MLLSGIGREDFNLSTRDTLFVTRQKGFISPNYSDIVNFIILAAKREICKHRANVKMGGHKKF